MPMELVPKIYHILGHKASLNNIDELKCYDNERRLEINSRRDWGLER